MNFITKIKKFIIETFGDIRIYSGGIILFGNSSYLLKGKEQRQVLDILKPGDIVFRHYAHYLGTIFIPGFWSHVGIYIGYGSVVHAVGGGVTYDDILTFMRTDNISVCRCSNETLIDGAIQYAKTAVNDHIPYDFDFNSKNNALYCSELVHNAFNNPKCEQKLDSYILPDDLFACDLFTHICDIRHDD